MRVLSRGLRQFCHCSVTRRRVNKVRPLFLTGFQKRWTFPLTVQPHNFCASNSREGWSAGLTAPGQCLHWSDEVRERISLTLFNTYCFHGHWFIIQNKTEVESTQYVAPNCKGSMLSTVSTSRVSSRAPNNSNHGIDCFLMGATLALEAIKVIDTVPSV